MNQLTVSCGYIPLVDCAPLVVAREIGFAYEEGLDLVLHKEPNWSSLRDKLALGHFDAAHMLSPVPVAMSLGLGGLPRPLDALSVLAINGEVIGVSGKLGRRMRDAGSPGDFASAAEIGRALIACGGERLRVAVPFPFSMHAELFYHWLGSLGLGVPGGLDVHTVPPPRMAEALATDAVDAICVGEPWGSMAVEESDAELILPGRAIWSFAPNKVLAVRRDWTETHRSEARPLLRALWRAAQWLADPAHATTVSEILARPRYLDVSTEIIERALLGRFVTDRAGSERRCERFQEFFASAATFPWRSQGAWIAARLAARMGLNVADAIATARACYRSDIYREALGPIGADLPGASEKLEGALQEPLPVPSTRGRLVLGPDAFFDGAVFDPDAP